MDCFVDAYSINILDSPVRRALFTVNEVAMKDELKVKLTNVKAKSMASHARKRYIKKTEEKREPAHSTPNPFIQRAAAKSIISIVICLCVLAISSIDNVVFNEATEGIDYLINHEMDAEEAFSFLKGMKQAVPAVSETNIKFSPPTNGIVIDELRDDTDNVVGKLYEAPDNNCYSACDGVVFFVDKVSVDCPYIRIRHEDGFDSVYMGIVSSVDVGDVVKRQQVIGTCIGDNLGFILMKNSKYIDSDVYMDNIE